MAEKPNIIIPIAGNKIKADVYSGNFEKWDQYIDAVVSELNEKTREYVVGQMNSLTNTVANIRLIAQPIIRLDNTILDDEIRLEGAEVSRETYASLFNIYGETYGRGNGVTTFNLPDFRNRAVWGATDFGYIEAGLPNITSFLDGIQTYGGTAPYKENGAIRLNRVAAAQGFWNGVDNASVFNFDLNASRSNPHYGRSSTVQPPAIKVRVVTRYK